MKKEFQPLIDYVLSKPKGEKELIEYLILKTLEKPNQKAVELLLEFISQQNEEHKKLLTFAKLRNYFRGSVIENTLSLKTWLDWINKYDFIKPESASLGNLTKFLNEKKPAHYQDMLDMISPKNHSLREFQIIGDMIDCVQKSLPLPDSIIAEITNFVPQKLTKEQKQEKRTAKNLLILNLALKPHPQISQMLGYINSTPSDVFNLVSTQKQKIIQTSIKALISQVDWSGYENAKPGDKIQKIEFYMDFLIMLGAAKPNNLNFGSLRHWYLYGFKKEEDEYLSTSGKKNVAYFLVVLHNVCGMDMEDMTDILKLYEPFIKHNFSTTDPQNTKKNYNVLDIFFKEILPSIEKEEDSYRHLKIHIEKLFVSYEKMKLNSNLENSIPQRKTKFKI